MEAADRVCTLAAASVSFVGGTTESFDGTSTS
jgi:hypothetical protein